ncbi:18909_t:CDS:2 [Funneliformis geosporum]|uniref:18909_t:CDS:1 n=1 Tax=Funneliformis geosporum TaxID=1117311 RepID=A0A9W4SXS3_9GLOM|nr:18909_t:CDS:2 [Funneliformis geosporum]
MSTNTNFINENDIIYEEDLEPEEDAEVYFITKNISVKMIIHSLTPIEYLAISQEGVAIIYHVEGWNNVEAIQYSMGKPCGQHNSTCIYLGNIGVVRKERICQGVKLCEFATPELLEIKHETVDPESDLCLKVNNEVSVNNIKNNTFAGRKLDKERFAAINVHQKYNIPYRGQDKSLITHNVLSNKCQANAKIKKSNNTKPVSDNCDNDDKENTIITKIDELEYQERILALKERELVLRK